MSLLTCVKMFKSFHFPQCRRVRHFIHFINFQFLLFCAIALTAHFSPIQQIRHMCLQRRLSRAGTRSLMLWALATECNPWTCGRTGANGWTSTWTFCMRTWMCGNHWLCNTPWLWLSITAWSVFTRKRTWERCCLRCWSLQFRSFFSPLVCLFWFWFLMLSLLSFTPWD